MKIILTILMALALSACAQYAKIPSTGQLQFKKLEWLIGNWQRCNAKPGESGIERWQKVSEYKLIGAGITLKGRDTVFAEALEICIQGKNILYIVKLSDERLPVVFKLTRINENGFTFENPDHDFPKKIEYQNSDNSLNAVVSAGNHKIIYKFLRSHF